MLAVVAGLVLHVTPVAKSRVGSVLSVIAGMTTSNATNPAMLQFLALNCLMRCNHARSSSRVRHDKPCYDIQHGTDQPCSYFNSRVWILNTRLFDGAGASHSTPVEHVTTEQM